MQPLAWGLMQIQPEDAVFSAFADQVRLQMVLTANTLGYTVARVLLASTPGGMEVVLDQLKVYLEAYGPLSMVVLVLGDWPPARVDDLADHYRLVRVVCKADGTL